MLLTTLLLSNKRASRVGKMTPKRYASWFRGRQLSANLSYIRKLKKR